MQTCDIGAKLDMKNCKQTHEQKEAEQSTFILSNECSVTIV